MRFTRKESTLMKNKMQNKQKLEIGGIGEPVMDHTIQGDHGDLNTTVMKVPSTGYTNNETSVHSESRMRPVDISMRAAPVEESPYNTGTQVSYIEKHKDELRKSYAEVEMLKEENNRLQRVVQSGSNEADMNLMRVTSQFQACMNSLEREKQDRLRFMIDADNLAKENQGLRYTNSRLEQEKNTLNKAYGDLKRQRDQAGVQRTQIIAIRNFLLAVELERIRLMYLEKEQECASARVDYNQSRLD